MPPQMPSTVLYGRFMVRRPVSAFSVGQEPVRESREEVVSDVLACQPGVVFDELSCCFAFGEYPVYEVVDFHIRAVEHGHLSRGGVFKVERRVQVQGHGVYASRNAVESGGSVPGNLAARSGERLEV